MVSKYSGSDSKWGAHGKLSSRSFWVPAQACTKLEVGSRNGAAKIAARKVIGYMALFFASQHATMAAAGAAWAEYSTDHGI